MSDRREYGVTTFIPEERIADTLCCALEGGSTYWADSVTVNWAITAKNEWAHEAIAHGANFTVRHEDYDTVVTYVPGKILQALKLMQEGWPEQLQNIIHEQEDADTGDLLFQLMCFGEVVYG